MTEKYGMVPQEDKLEHAKGETRADSARVEGCRCKSLNAAGTKTAYDELNRILDALANTIICNLDQMVPHLAEMQSLLSQRGKDRRKVLKRAGLPGWTEWAKEYAAKFNCSVRTIQERINLFRMPRSTGKRDKPLRLDHRQQSALIKAQLAANDVVDALESGKDWRLPLIEYKKVAVNPARLDSFANTLSQQTDWEDVVRKLVGKLARHSDTLPTDVIGEMHSVQELLQGSTSPHRVVEQEAVTQPSEVPAAPTSGLEPDGLSTHNEGQEILLGTVAGPQLTSEAAIAEPPVLRSPNGVAEVAPALTPDTPAEETHEVAPESAAPKFSESVTATECPPPQSDDSHPALDKPAVPDGSSVAEASSQMPVAAASIGTCVETVLTSGRRRGNTKYGLPEIPNAQIVQVGESAVLYLPRLVPDPENWIGLLSPLPWTADEQVLGGKNLMLKRETFHFDNPASKSPLLSNAAIISMRKMLARLVGNPWEQCICNRYPDGSVGIGCHRDAQHTLMVASMSFGASRQMGFCGHDESSIAESLPLITLEPGSLVVFGGEFNDLYKHGIKEDSRVTEPRISLTFRHFAGM
jgi:hypothetical protein